MKNNLKLKYLFISLTEKYTSLKIYKQNNKKYKNKSFI